MKNFFKKFLLLATILFVVVSCSPPKETTEEEEEANQRFFDIVYLTQASKITGQDSWTVVQGDQRFKFVQNSDEDTGTFTVSFANFREPQLVSSNCSGGFSGSFSIDSSDDTTVVDEENTSYNPLDPYVPDTENPDDGTGDDEEVSEILVFTFSVNVPTGSDNRSLTAGCRDIPEIFAFRVVRFESGDVILTDQSRDVDYYLVPEIIETTE